MVFTVFLTVFGYDLMPAPMRCQRPGDGGGW